jgi:glutathione synthase/RimK-type ligase-like ATP-grasp enzyme
LPKISDAEFDSAFSRLLVELDIDVVFATHDSVLDYLAPRAHCMGVTLINGDPQTAAIARRQSATYACFRDADWAPHMFESVEAVKAWPIIVKPDLGQGGQGVTLANDPQQARAAMDAMQFWSWSSTFRAKRSPWIASRTANGGLSGRTGPPANGCGQASPRTLPLAGTVP